MLSIRETVQKLNLEFAAKINISKPENALKTKVQEFIEELLPEQRKQVPEEIIEVFRSLTGTEVPEENEPKQCPKCGCWEKGVDMFPRCSCEENSNMPEFKGIWKNLKEKLWNFGMSEAEFKALDLKFRSQEVFHMKKKGLIIQRENGFVKLVQVAPESVVIREKAPNGNSVPKVKKILNLNFEGNETLPQIEAKIGVLELKIQELQNLKSLLVTEKVKLEEEKAAVHEVESRVLDNLAFLDAPSFGMVA